MKALIIPVKQQLTLILLSALSVSFNPVMAQSDKQMMGEVQKAREMAQQSADHENSIESTDESQKFHGVFYGYLPCSGCAGTKMTLSLKNKKNYLLVTQKAQASSREYYEKGKYIWDDKSRTVTLRPRKNSDIRKFRIKDEATLIHLNPKGSPMQGKQDQYSLTRRDKVKSREAHH